MAKTKKRKIFSDYSDFTIFVVVLLIVTLGVVTWLFSLLTGTIRDHRSLENIANQACFGIAAANTSGFNVDTRTLYATSSLSSDPSNQDATANQRCVVAGSTKKQTSDNKTVDRYNFGSDVAYFKSNKAAKKYADSVIGKIRNWNADATKTDHTTIIKGSNTTYFDAYSVKGDAVMRLSLPCSNDIETAQEDIDSCQAKADRAIAIFAKKINPLNI